MRHLDRWFLWIGVVSLAFAGCAHRGYLVEGEGVSASAPSLASPVSTTGSPAAWSQADEAAAGGGLLAGIHWDQASAAPVRWRNRFRARWNHFRSMGVYAPSQPAESAPTWQVADRSPLQAIRSPADGDIGDDSQLSGTVTVPAEDPFAIEGSQALRLIPDQRQSSRVMRTEFDHQPSAASITARLRMGDGTESTPGGELLEIDSDSTLGSPVGDRIQSSPAAGTIVLRAIPSSAAYRSGGNSEDRTARVSGLSGEADGLKGSSTK